MFALIDIFIFLTFIEKKIIVQSS